MSEPVDLYGSYQHFGEEVLAAVRAETYGRDIGQNSWLTVDEYERLLPGLGLGAESRLLEVASGSGGPALYVARAHGWRVMGIDSDKGAVATATRAAERDGLGERVTFGLADANGVLPFGDAMFDAVLCMDAMNHLPDRLGVLKEWGRVLRSGGRALFTDPVVITGPVTNAELAVRASIGVFVFVPSGVNEKLIAEAGLRLVGSEDVSGNAAMVAGRWRDARAKHREALTRLEGAERFEGLQRFLDAVHRLTGEGRLSRIAYLVERAGNR